MKWNTMLIISVLYSYLHHCTCQEGEMIINAWSNDTKGIPRSVKFPITGNDYWITRNITYGDAAEWVGELNRTNILKALYLEFNHPPTKLVILASTEGKEWLPVKIIDYKEAFTQDEKTEKVFFTKPSNVNLESAIPFKFIKLRLMNDIPNLVISVNLIKIKIFSEQGSYFLVRRLVNSYQGVNHLCLKKNESGDLFSLVNCHYCILYELEYCSFQYNGLTPLGFQLKYPNENKFFYVKNLLPQSQPDQTSQTPQNGNLIQSYLSDELDYINDLQDLSASSTMNEEYHVRSILDGTLSYWSSSLMTKPLCLTTNITVGFKDEIILKSAEIDWVREPDWFRLVFCKSNEKCVAYPWSENIFEKHSSFPDIYEKTKKFILEMKFENDREKKNDRYCIVSIKRLMLTKNDILLRPTSAIFSDNSQKLHFTQNFFLTKLNFKGLDDMVKMQHFLKEGIANSNLLTARIQTISKYIKEHFFSNSNQTASIEKVISNKLTEVYEKYKTEKVKLLTQLKNFLTLLKKNTKESEYLGKIPPLGSSGSITLGNLKQQYQAFSVFLQNVTIFQQDIQKIISNSNLFMESLKSDLNRFIVINGTKFNEILSDKYLKQLLTITKEQNKFIDIVGFLDQTKIISRQMSYIEDSLNSLGKLTKQSIKSFLLFINDQFKKIVERKSRQEQELKHEAELAMQNIQLIRVDIHPLFLRIGDMGCKMLNLIKNSFFDNYDFKFFVQFTRESYGTENIMILKFYSKDLFLYLKITSSFVELWKKKYEKEEVVMRYSNCTSIYDDYNKVHDFSKIFFFYVQVDSGQLIISLNIEYIPIPEGLREFLNSKNVFSFEKAEGLTNIQRNPLNEYFTKGKIIYEKGENDLFYKGFLAYFSEQENIHLFTMGRSKKKELEDKTKKESDTQQILKLSSKFDYSFFPNADGLIKTTIPEIVANSLKLSQGPWDLYDTQFQVVSKFYFKFELDVERLYGQENDNSIYFTFSSDNNDSCYFFQIIKLTSQVIFRVIKISKEFGIRYNLLKTSLGYVSKKKIVLSFVKEHDSLIIHIKSTRDQYKTLLTIKDYYFIKFAFLLSPLNYDSVSSIYFSDIYDLHYKKKIQDKILRIKDRCSASAFEEFKCWLRNRFDPLCVNIFCKSCCTKKLSKENRQEYQKCYDKCKVINDNHLEKMKKDNPLAKILR